MVFVAALFYFILTAYLVRNCNKAESVHNDSFGIVYLCHKEVHFANAPVLSNRVTRLGDFFTLGRFVSLAIFNTYILKWACLFSQKK
jgi:hypothetical protein